MERAKMIKPSTLIWDQYEYVSHIHFDKLS